MTHEQEPNYNIDFTRLNKAKQQLIELLNSNPVTADNFQGVGLGNGFLQVYLTTEATIDRKYFPRDFEGIPIIYRASGSI